MISPVETLLEMIFTTTAMCVSCALLVLISVFLWVAGERISSFSRRLAFVALMDAAIFAVPNVINILYPFRVVDRHVSCLGSWSDGTVPYGVLHHPSTNELAVIEQR
jgi:hypothetical protein